MNRLVRTCLQTCNNLCVFFACSSYLDPRKTEKVRKIVNIPFVHSKTRIVSPDIYSLLICSKHVLREMCLTMKHKPNVRLNQQRHFLFLTTSNILARISKK